MDGKLIAAFVAFLIEAGLQVSGYTNWATAVLFWGTAVILLILWLWDWARQRYVIRPLRKIVEPLILAALGLAFLTGAAVWAYLAAERRMLIPEAALRFVYPTHPALLLVNISDVVVRQIKWMPALWNLDTLPEDHRGLPIPAGTFDWLPPRKEGGPINLFETTAVLPLIGAGNRIFGSVSVSRPECSNGRTYWVYIVWGEGGWYSEIEGKTDGAVLIPRGITNEQLKDTLLNQMASIPPANRLSIEGWVTTNGAR